MTVISGLKNCTNWQDAIISRYQLSSVKVCQSDMKYNLNLHHCDCSSEENDKSQKEKDAIESNNPQLPPHAPSPCPVSV